MSWDIFALDFPADVRRLSELPDGFQPQAIGSRAEIAARILAVVPTTRFAADCKWGDIEGPDYSINLFLGETEPCTAVAFAVRGINPDVVDVVADILDHLGMRAAQSGPGDDFFDRHSSRKTFAAWCEYRDQIVDDR